jgi:hypothetical protein
VKKHFKKYYHTKKILRKNIYHNLGKKIHHIQCNMKKCLRIYTLIFKYSQIGLFFFNGQQNLSIITKQKIKAFQIAKKTLWLPTFWFVIQCTVFSFCEFLHCGYNTYWILLKTFRCKFEKKLPRKLEKFINVLKNEIDNKKKGNISYFIIFLDG